MNLCLFQPLHHYLRFQEKFYKDMVVSYDFQEESLKILINYHIVQVLIISEIKNLFNFSKKEIANILAIYSRLVT